MLARNNLYYLFTFLLLFGCKQKEVQTKADAINYFNKIKEGDLDIFKCYSIFPRDYNSKNTFFFIEKYPQCNKKGKVYRGAFLFNKGILEYSDSYNLKLSDEVENVIMEFKILQELGCKRIFYTQKGIQIDFDSKVFLYKRLSDFVPDDYILLMDDWYFILPAE